MFNDLSQYIALESLNTDPYTKRLEDYLQNHIKTAEKFHTKLDRRANDVINKKDPKPAFVLTNKKSQKDLLDYDTILLGSKEVEEVTDFIKTLFSKPVSTKKGDLNHYTQSLKSFVNKLKTFVLHSKNNDGYYILYPKFKETPSLLKPKDTKYKDLGYDAEYLKKLEEIKKITDDSYKKLIGYQKDFLAYDKKYRTLIEKKNLDRETKAIMRHHHYITYQCYRGFLERAWYIYYDYMLDVVETIQN